MYSPQFLPIFLVFLVKIDAIRGCAGCVNLDEASFAKIRPKFDVILVKFDVAFPYGDKHEVFTRFAAEVAGNPHILLGEVGVKDYGEKENEEFARRHGLTKEDFPALRLFKSDEEEPVAFPPDVDFTLNSLREFVRDNTRIYLGLPGCVQAYDELAGRFVRAHRQQEVLEEAAKLAGALEDAREREAAKVYLVLMRKIVENGAEFIGQETERVSKLLKGKISSKKQVELNARLNILRAFSAPTKDEL